MTDVIYVDFEAKERISDASYTTDQFTCDVCGSYYEYDSREGKPKTRRIKAPLSTVKRTVVMCEYCIDEMNELLK